jgi:hypothetical protein
MTKRIGEEKKMKAADRNKNNCSPDEMLSAQQTNNAQCGRQPIGLFWPRGLFGRRATVVQPAKNRTALGVAGGARENGLQPHKAGLS